MHTRREQITGPDALAARTDQPQTPVTREAIDKGIELMAANDAAAPKCCHCKGEPPSDDHRDHRHDVMPLGYLKGEPKILVRVCSWTEPIEPQLEGRFLCGKCAEAFRADPAADRYVKQARALGMELPE